MKRYEREFKKGHGVGLHKYASLSQPRFMKMLRCFSGIIVVSVSLANTHQYACIRK